MRCRLERAASGIALSSSGSKVSIGWAPFFGALPGPGNRVVAQGEDVVAPGVLEDRVEQLTMDVDRASADILPVDAGEEALDVLGRDRAELAAGEFPHDPRPSLASLSGTRRGEEVSVTRQGRGLGRLLEFKVCEPGLDGILEARLAFCRRDLLLSFDLGDHPGHLAVGSSLIQVAAAHPPSAPLPATARIRLQPRSAQPALALPLPPVAPLRLVEGRSLVGANDQGARLDQLRFHPGPPMSRCTHRG